MKTVFRIWLTALLIQPILFSAAALFVIPFEIIGSLPAILVFGLVVQMLLNIKMPVAFKWFILLFTAATTALLSSYCVMALLGDVSLGEKDLQFLLPAPIAALLAVLINGKGVHKMFRSGIFIIPKDV